jgi:hypothetical protein
MGPPGYPGSRRPQPRMKGGRIADGGQPGKDPKEKAPGLTAERRFQRSAYQYRRTRQQTLW